MVSVSNILAALDNGQEKLYLKHTFSSKKDFIDESDLSSNLRALPNITIKGTVTDELGENLPGVSVTLKGTTQGAFTDIDGSYSRSGILSFSRINATNLLRIKADH